MHFSHEDLQGLPGEPIARRTPLGWTCIGNRDGNQGRRVQTNFIHAYFVRKESKLEKIDSTLRKFWEVEAVNKSEPVLGIETELQWKRSKVLKICERTLSSWHSVERKLTLTTKQL